MPRVLELCLRLDGRQAPRETHALGGAFCLFTTPRLWVYFVLAGDLMFVCLPVIVRVTLCEGSIVSSILDRVLSTHLCVPWNGLFRHMHLNP